MAKRIKKFNKMTTGFVTQEFELVKGEYVCVFQVFTGGDMVDYENNYGEKITTTPEIRNAYQAYDMIQPPNKSQN
jgi:hypothetical protein